jgi:hypothetical protein
MSFERWSEDVELSHRLAKRQVTEIAPCFHGLEVGALLVCKTFHRGIGDLNLIKPKCTGILFLAGFPMRHLQPRIDVCPGRCHLGTLKGYQHDCSNRNPRSI